MLTIKAMAGGETYAARHLSNNDYYSVGETITGQWMGRGAELLGLQGNVTIEQFEAIRLGVDPSTGEFLRQRQNVDRFNQDGEKIATARNLYDFTVSAPKAVSVQALEDPRLIGAHKAGVSEITAEMERLAGARVRRLGANDTRITSNLVIARYDHDTSRELDPQIHTHLVASNLTFDGAEGKWKALQASAIYEQREYLTEVYRNVVARELTNYGYRIKDRFEHGKDYGFGIAGIKEATLEKYSQRSAQRDAAIAEFLDKNGRLPSDNEIARFVRDSRPEKLTEITTAEVKAGQRARMTTEEAAALKDLREAALDRGSIREQSPAAVSLAYAREHIFERVSVAKEHELYTEALRHGRGRVDLSELKAALLAEVASGAMLTARGEVATKESLKRERQMVATINEGAGQYRPLGRAHEFVASDRLRPEQKTAVLAALDSRDLAINIRGAVSKAYREAAAVPNAKGKARDVLVVAATHDEIRSVTHAIRQDRKRAGELSQGETFVRHTALNWTEAQRKQTKNYQPGQVLIFHKATKDIDKNEALEVVTAGKTGVAARKPNGQEVLITVRHAAAFAVFERDTLEVSTGDKLLLQANWRDKQFRATNGELVTVAAVESGAIKLSDGRHVPAEYHQFTHGYVVTAHRSQGKTVDY